MIHPAFNYDYSKNEKSVIDELQSARRNRGAGLVDGGANISIRRQSQVHDTRKQGFTSYLLAHAREKGVAAYVGDGECRWAAAHVGDTARLYRLAFERATGSRP